MRFEVMGSDGNKKILDLALPAETWRLVEECRAELAKRGKVMTTEEVAAEILGIGLSMTSGVG